jgi:hypothetical protein
MSEPIQKSEDPESQSGPEFGDIAYVASTSGRERAGTNFLEQLAKSALIPRGVVLSFLGAVAISQKRYRAVSRKWDDQNLAQGRY